MTRSHPSTRAARTAGSLTTSARACAPPTQRASCDRPAPSTTSTTGAARDLRAPGARTFTARDIVGGLVDPPAAQLPASPVSSPSRAARGGGDQLLAIPASEYVPALTGRPVRPVRRDGKARCPWHAGGEERTPSLHAYQDPDLGWFCFGCDAGGSIIDFGARLWSIDARGRGYHEIRERLAAALGIVLQEAA